MRSISVTRNGSPIAGRISLVEDETRFRFNPVGAWTPDRHAIRFDVDTPDPTQSSSATTHVEIAFDVSAR